VVAGQDHWAQHRQRSSRGRGSTRESRHHGHHQPRPSHFHAHGPMLMKEKPQRQDANGRQHTAMTCLTGRRALADSHCPRVRRQSRRCGPRRRQRPSTCPATVAFWPIWRRTSTGVRTRPKRPPPRSFLPSMCPNGPRAAKFRKLAVSFRLSWFQAAASAGGDCCGPPGRSPKREVAGPRRAVHARKATPRSSQAGRRGTQSARRSSCRPRSGCCRHRPSRSIRPSSPRTSRCRCRRPIRSRSRSSSRG
jgi:hypothetical protein